MTDLADIPEDLPAQQIAMLGELAQLGMTLARAIVADPDAHDDAALAFDRVSRAVRLTLMLQDKLARAPAYLSPQKQRLKRILTRAAERDGKLNERTTRQITERLDKDFCGDILDRPFSEIIAIICKDLGIDPNWQMLMQEAWAQNEMKPTTPNPPPLGEGGPRSGGGGLSASPGAGRHKLINPHPTGLHTEPLPPASLFPLTQRVRMGSIPMPAPLPTRPFGQRGLSNAPHPVRQTNQE